MSAMENTEVRNIISETFKCYASVTLGRHAPWHAGGIPPGMPNGMPPECRGACPRHAGRHAWWRRDSVDQRSYLMFI